MKANHVSICVCTFKRPGYLQRLLEHLERQDTDGTFTFEIIVVDNDEGGSAEIVADLFCQRESIPTTYWREPQRNIALCRNRAISLTTGEWIAFIDDDEFPVPSWLRQFVQTCKANPEVAGVLGPVRPHFDRTPPAWIVKGGFCERPEYATGRPMSWNECRSGNVILRKKIFSDISLPFDPKFGTGGEDVDFFKRMADQGHQFIWCNEAVAYESVPPSRQSRKYMIHRALLRGKNGMLRSEGRLALLAKSIVAIPLYLVMLPGALLRGQHVFMKYSIKFCDHFGRMLALMGINPVKERQM
jgi:glycosyltransferase involved in cell wall biosynthesis